MTQDSRHMGLLCFLCCSLTLTPLPAKKYSRHFRPHAPQDATWQVKHRVRGISQRVKGIIIERVIPLSPIVSLDHDRYLGMNSCYLAGDAALVNCDLLELSDLLSSKETRQHALVIPSAPPYTTIANRQT